MPTEGTNKREDPDIVMYPGAASLVYTAASLIWLFAACVARLFGWKTWTLSRPSGHLLTAGSLLGTALIGSRAGEHGRFGRNLAPSIMLAGVLPLYLLTGWKRHSLEAIAAGATTYGVGMILWDVDLLLTQLKRIPMHRRGRPVNEDTHDYRSEDLATAARR